MENSGCNENFQNGVGLKEEENRSYLQCFLLKNSISTSAIGTQKAGQSKLDLLCARTCLNFQIKRWKLINYASGFVEFRATLLPYGT